MKSEKGIISSSRESLTNVDRACILSPPFYFWDIRGPSGERAGFSKMEFATKIGKFTERSVELKDKRKTGNKTAGRGEVESSVDHYVGALRSRGD